MIHFIRLYYDFNILCHQPAIKMLQVLKIFNTRLMWPWVMKLLVDIYLDIWIRGLCKKVGHYS